MDDKTFGQIVDEITASERQRDYGSPLLNFTRIAIDWTNKFRLWGLIDYDKIVTPRLVAWTMIGLKEMREINTAKDDNIIDTGGYAACLWQMQNMYSRMMSTLSVYVTDGLPIDFSDLDDGHTTLGDLYTLLGAVAQFEVSEGEATAEKYQLEDIPF